MPSVPSDLTQNANIPVVGIVGGVCAGKSSVVRKISDLRLLVIDADHIGHELLLNVDLSRKICDAFGTEILDEAGKILRRRLADKVFGVSAEQSINRDRLNEILHPAIRSEIHRTIKHAPKDVEAIILDAALLLETGWADECAAVVFIDTPSQMRQQRAAASRGWSVEELHRREASQWSLKKKRENAQFVVDNSGSVEMAAEQLKSVLNQIIRSKSK